MAMAMGRRARRRARRRAAAGREAEITLATLSGDLQLKIFSELCDLCDPGSAVAFSSASSELRALTRAECQQLRPDETNPTIKALYFDTELYAEGRTKVAAITARCRTSSSSWTYGPWKRARVLLWDDHNDELLVTVAKSVSQRFLL